MIREAALIRGAIANRTRWRGRRPPVRQLAEAMLRGDADTAGDLAEQFMARVGSRLAVFSDLVQPAQAEIGDRWYRGQARIDDERRAAEVVAVLVGMLPPTPSRCRVPAGSRCLLTVLPRERHTLGVGMFALVLEDEGWEVDLLDNDCEPDDVPDLVERTRPRLVGLSAGHLPSVPRMARVVAAIRGLSVPVLVGGGAFNRAGDLWRRVGASAYGPDPRIGAFLARKLARP
jgi:methanogenic corrinoid protein MtbC1